MNRKGRTLIFLLVFALFVTVLHSFSSFLVREQLKKVSLENETLKIEIASLTVALNNSNQKAEAASADLLKMARLISGENPGTQKIHNAIVATQTPVYNGKIIDINSPPPPASKMTIIGTYKITPKDLTLQEAVTAGKYDWVNPYILSAPEFQREPAVLTDEMILVQFSCGISSEEVVSRFASRSLRQANIWELLAIGEKCPDLQRDGPIVVLGSSCMVDGSRYVPYLFEYDSKRYLSLHSWLVEWSARCRFLAVRE